MATGTAGTSGTRTHYPTMHRLYKAISYTDDGSTLTLGVIPASSAVPACVVRGGVVVSTAFNAGTNNFLDIGTSGDTDGFATDLALGTIGVISTDEMATSDDAYLTSDTTIQCVVDLTGTAATAGAGVVWVEYFVMNG